MNVGGGNMAFSVTRILSRNLYTSAQKCAKPGYFLYTLLDKEKYIEKRAQAWAGRGPQIANVVPSDNSRRQTVLNSLYMDSITDILASEFGNDLSKYRIQIHNVRISKDLRVVNVYWSCDLSGIVNEEAAQALADIEAPIRRELSTVRHMGLIPKVKFIYFAGAAKALAVGSILDKLRQSGELDNVEPAAMPVKEYPQVYGLNREKILGILAMRSLPADFLSQEGGIRAETGTRKTTEDFVKSFRSNAGYRLRSRSVRDDTRWHREAERLILEEHFKKVHGDDLDEELYEEELVDDFEQETEQPIEDDWDR